MKKLALQDVKSLEEYEAMRSEFLSSIIDLRRRRRLAIGEKMSLSFENRKTVLFQVQEMARVEKITSREKLQHELDIYNALIPDENELRATLFIEITDQERLKEELSFFIGIDEGYCALLLGEERIPIQFEEGHSKEDRVSAVHYVHIPFRDDQVELWREGECTVEVMVNHPNYTARAEIPEALRQELCNDFRDG